MPSRETVFSSEICFFLIPGKKRRTNKKGKIALPLFKPSKYWSLYSTGNMTTYFESVIRY